MALPSDSKKIDGVEYEVTAFGARQGFRLQAAIAKIAAPAIKDLAAALPEGMTDVMSLDIGKLTPALGKLVESIVENDPKGDLIIELLERTQRDGVPIDDRQFDTVYAGNYAEMVKAVIFVIQVNRFFSMSGTGSR